MAPPCLSLPGSSRPVPSRAHTTGGTSSPHAGATLLRQASAISQEDARRQATTRQSLGIVAEQQPRVAARCAPPVCQHRSWPSVRPSLHRDVRDSSPVHSPLSLKTCPYCQFMLQTESLKRYAVSETCIQRESSEDMANLYAGRRNCRIWLLLRALYDAVLIIGEEEAS